MKTVFKILRSDFTLITFSLGLGAAIAVAICPSLQTAIQLPVLLCVLGVTVWSSIAVTSHYRMTSLARDIRDYGFASSKSIAYAMLGTSLIWAFMITTGVVLRPEVFGGELAEMAHWIPLTQAVSAILSHIAIVMMVTPIAKTRVIVVGGQNAS